MESNLNFPKLSIIVPAYNVENYIEETIESLLSQTYPNIEIIVVNDGSTDKTGDIMEKYVGKNEIKYFYKSNGGLSSARNEGLKHVTGDFIAFVDSDDVIAADTYLSNISDMINMPDIDVVVFPMMFGWTSDKEVINIPGEDILKRKNEIYELYMSQKISFSMCDKIFRKRVFDNIRFQEGLVYEDVECNRLILNEIRKIKLSDKGLYRYRRTPNSILTSRMTFKKMHDYFYVLFSFLEQAQNSGVGSSHLNYYLSRWMRLKYFLLYSRFTESEQQKLDAITRKVKISKLDIISQLLTGKLSLKKVQSLWALSCGNVYKALWLSNSKYDRQTFLASYDRGEC